MKDQIDLLLYDVLEQELSEHALFSDPRLMEVTGEAMIIASESGTLSGVSIARRLFEIVDDTLFIKVINPDGTEVEKGDMIMIIGGRLSSIDRVKPIAMSFLRRMSAIASNTADLVKLLEGSKIKVFDSASHTPLFYPFEQLAVQHGGGTIFDEMFPNITSVHTLFLNQDTFGRQSETYDGITIDHFEKYYAEVDTISGYEVALNSDYKMISLRDMSIRDILHCIEMNSSKSIILGGPYTISDVQSITNTSILGIRYVHSNTVKQVMNIQLTMNR